MAIKMKRRGTGLEIKTFEGKEGTYLVFRDPDGSFHAFLEVEAKAAAKSCGSKVKIGTTHRHWSALWESGSAGQRG